MSQPPPPPPPPLHALALAVGAVGAVPIPNISDLSNGTTTPTYYGYLPTDSANPFAVAAPITPNADTDIILDEKFFRGNWYKAISPKWTNPAVFYHLINAAAERDLPDAILISLAGDIRQVVLAGRGKFWKRTSSTNNGHQLLSDPTKDICATIRKIRDHRRITEGQQRVHPSNLSTPHNYNLNNRVGPGPATTAGVPHDLATLVNMYVKNLIAVNGVSYHATHDTVVRFTIVKAIQEQMEEKGIQFVRHLDDGSYQILGGTEQIISFFLMLEKPAGSNEAITHRALHQNATNSQTMQHPNGNAPKGHNLTMENNEPLDVFVKKLISGNSEHFHATQDNAERYAIVTATQKQIDEKGARFVRCLDDGSYQILEDQEQIIEFFLNLEGVREDTHHTLEQPQYGEWTGVGGGFEQSSESHPTTLDRKPAPKEEAKKAAPIDGNYAAERSHDDGNGEWNKLLQARIQGQGTPERVGQPALAKRNQPEATSKKRLDP